MAVGVRSILDQYACSLLFSLLGFLASWFDATMDRIARAQRSACAVLEVKPEEKRCIDRGRTHEGIVLAVLAVKLD